MTNGCELPGPASTERGALFPNERFGLEQRRDGRIFRLVGIQSNRVGGLRFLDRLYDHRLSFLDRLYDHRLSFLDGL